MKKKLKIVEKVEVVDLVGNTSNQISASKYWCFTLHSNYNKDVLVELVDKFNDFCCFYIFSFETGKSGETPHFQGFIEAEKVFRPSELKLTNKIHWEKSVIKKKTLIRNINICYICKEYCTGDLGYKGAVKAYKDMIHFKCNHEELITKVLKVKYPSYIYAGIKILDEARLYDWENEILSIVAGDPCERSIYWYWSNKGNVGKSTFCKYLCVKYAALIVSGNAKDMKYAIQIFVERNGEYPKIIVLDIARNTSIEKLSYSGFEEVKNGCFFSGKYESGMVIGNCPHFICFSNKEPYTETMSEDRWKVFNID